MHVYSIRLERDSILVTYTLLFATVSPQHHPDRPPNHFTQLEVFLLDALLHLVKALLQLSNNPLGFDLLKAFLGITNHLLGLDFLDSIANFVDPSLDVLIGVLQDGLEALADAVVSHLWNALKVALAWSIQQTGFQAGLHLEFLLNVLVVKNGPGMCHTSKWDMTAFRARARAAAAV